MRGVSYPLSSRPSVLCATLLPGFPPDQRDGDKEFVIRRAATNRVLNVLRHWASKHSQVGGGPCGSWAPGEGGRRQWGQEGGALVCPPRGLRRVCSDP